MRINANLATVFAHGPNPDWTAIDPLLSKLQAAGLKPIIVMGYTPGWLQPAVTPCPTTVLGLAPYYAEPTDIGAWAKLTATFVDHVTSAFSNLVAAYEIWNEPDLPSALCVTPDSDTTRRNAYLQMYDAAAPLMKAAAQRRNATIRIGGPVFVRLSSTWLNALLNDPVASQNLDFVSYHYYLGYTEVIAAGLNWDGSGGAPSEWHLTQDPKKGFAAVFNSISALVRAGKQPNPASTPIYLTEYNDDSAFENDCCRNSPQYSPLFNTMVVADLLNSVYSGAQNVPGNMTYFAASVDIGSFCLLGIIDATMDCATSPGTMKPYPQYYAYQLLASPKYLNLAGGGNMAVSVSIPSPLIGTAFYTPTSDVLVLVNPSGSDAVNIPINLLNPGSSAGNATAYLLNSSTVSPAAQPAILTGSLAAISTTLTVLKHSVVALSFAAQAPPPDFAATVAPPSATIKAGQQSQFTLTLTPVAGFRQSINLSCSGAPQNATCSIAPAAVTLDGASPGSATVTVTTQGATAAAALLPSTWLSVAMVLLVFTWCGARKRPVWRSARLLYAVLAVVILVSCGGGGGGGGTNTSGSGSSNPPTGTNPGTPTGSYTLTITESSGTVTHATQLPITIQ